jgi:hypothetical protein
LNRRQERKTAIEFSISADCRGHVRSEKERISILEHYENRPVVVRRNFYSEILAEEFYWEHSLSGALNRHIASALIA